MRNEGFELISQIRFKNLNKINLARNKIKNVSYLDNTLLPHLEILNLSDNLIINIEPVAEYFKKIIYYKNYV